MVFCSPFLSFSPAHIYPLSFPIFCSNEVQIGNLWEFLFENQYCRYYRSQFVKRRGMEVLLGRLGGSNVCD